MFYWKKLGKIFSPQEIKDKNWIKEFAQAPSTLLFDEFVRVYFSCRPAADSNGQYVSYSAYVDFDKKYLLNYSNIAEKPIIELGGLGEFDEYGIYPVSVIREGKEVWAYYAGWTRCESVPFNVGIGLAISYDEGKTFKKKGNGPVISYTINEPFVMSGPKIRRFNNQWQLFYISGRKWKMSDGRPEPIYKIRMATSTDGINWEKYDKDLIKSRVELDEAQASPDVFYKNGIYHMFFCYRYSSMYRSKKYGYRIGYASSTDLINWERDDTKAGIDVSENEWDSQMISYPHIFEIDDKIYMAYLGDQVGRYGFGLAILQGKME